MAVFKSRNPYYLRVSRGDVIQLYLYLDERHLNWMSDRTLQHVLADLRPRILTKLKLEAEGITSPIKRSMVDTHRGEGYQFCYFLRKSEPHSTLLKTRNFTALDTKAVPCSHIIERSKTSTQRSKSVQKRKRISESPGQPTTNKPKAKRPKRGVAKGKRPTEWVSDDDFFESLSEDDSVPGTDDDKAEFIESTTDAVVQVEPNFTMDVGEEEKPKPVLRLGYKEFRIYGQCLCIVVEPWPPLQSVAETHVGRAQSLVPSSRLFDHTAGGLTRRPTPLFLSDEDENERPQLASATSQSAMVEESIMEVDEDEPHGMMEFSQILRVAGEFSAGIAADNDNEADGVMFFGDADEARDF